MVTFPFIQTLIKVALYGSGKLTDGDEFFMGYPNFATIERRRLRIP
jgi:hypothetical protein